MAAVLGTACRLRQTTQVIPATDCEGTGTAMVRRLLLIGRWRQLGEPYYKDRGAGIRMAA